MLKWHPNKIEIFAADLCLKEWGISRDIRQCIKLCLFDKYCVTDAVFNTFEIAWSAHQMLLYKCFQNYRINFVSSSKNTGKSFLIDHLAAACYKVGLSTIIIAATFRRVHLHLDTVKDILGEPILNPNLLLGSTKLNEMSRNVIFIDDYEHIEISELCAFLELCQKNVHIFAFRGTELVEHEHVLEDMYKTYEDVMNIVKIDHLVPVSGWTSMKKIRKLQELYK